MDIKSISTLTLPQSAIPVAAPKNQNTVSTQTVPEEKSSKTHKNFKKQLPYVAGAVVLAGLGIYASKNKLAKLFSRQSVENSQKEVLEVIDEVVSEIKKENTNKIHEKMREIISPNVLPQNRNNTINNMKIILPEGTVKVLPRINGLKEEVIQIGEQVQANNSAREQLFLPLPMQKQEKFVCIGFENGKPVYEKYLPVAQEELTPAISAVEEAKKSINLLNDEVIAKIIKNKKDNAAEVDKIIVENTKDGHIDFNMIRKAARDFSADEAGRGGDRLHHAANLLEQAHLKEFIKTKGGEKVGLYNFYDSIKTDTELFSIYTQMPLEEAANRLNYLRYNELLDCKAAKDMTPDEFFEKSFSKLIEKTQFKKYNDIFKIDGNFNDIMQLNQGFRKETEKVITEATLSNASGTPLERLTEIAKNETNAHKAAYIMERAIYNDFMSRHSGEKLFSQLEKEFLNNETLFEVYKKMPKEQAVQRVNAFRRFGISPEIVGSDNEHTLGFLSAAAEKLGVKIS